MGTPGWPGVSLARRRLPLTKELAAGSVCPPSHCLQRGQHLHVLFILATLLLGDPGRFWAWGMELGGLFASVRPQRAQYPLQAVLAQHTGTETSPGLGHWDAQWPSCPHRKQESLTGALGCPPPKHPAFFFHFCFHTWVGHNGGSRGERREG